MLRVITSLFILFFIAPVFGRTHSNSVKSEEANNRPIANPKDNPVFTNPFTKPAHISATSNAKTNFEEALKNFDSQKEVSEAGVNFYKKESKEVEPIFYTECQLKTVDQAGNTSYKQTKLWTAMLHPGMLDQKVARAKLGKMALPGESKKSSFYFETMDEESKDRYSAKNYSLLLNKMEMLEKEKKTDLLKDHEIEHNVFVQKFTERSADPKSVGRWMVERNASLGYDSKDIKKMEIHVSFKRDPNLSQNEKALVLKMEFNTPEAKQTIVCMK